MLKLTKGQGQKVKGQGQTYKFVKKHIWLYTMNQWLDMDDTCTYDLCQWDVKVDLRSSSQGQSQICSFVKTLFWLYIMNQWLDIDDTYTHDWYK